MYFQVCHHYCSVKHVSVWGKNLAVTDERKCTPKLKQSNLSLPKLLRVVLQCKRAATGQQEGSQAWSVGAKAGEVEKVFGADWILTLAKVSI